MTKRLFLIFFAFSLVACSLFSRTAEDALKEGQYLEAVEIITQYVEEKGEAKLDNDDLTRFRNIISASMGHFEQQLLTAERTNYIKRIDAYNSLLKMKNRLGNRFFSQQIYFFNNKYDVIELRKLIAEEYYLYGNSIQGNDSKTYYQKAQLYKKGLESYNYKDIEKQYQTANTQYMQLAAQEFYQEGLNHAQNKYYKQASESFAKAVEVYKPLGNYKDSSALAKKYDKLYRTEAAAQYYADAKNKTASTYKEHRDIAALYQSAIDIYAPYGAYKDAAKLAKSHKQKGVVNVYIAPNSSYDTLLQRALNLDYINMVSSPSSAQVSIKIEVAGNYSQSRPRTNTDAMTKNVVIEGPSEANGFKEKVKTYYFNQIVSSSANQLELQARVMATGKMDYRQNHRVVEGSYYREYRYSGDVPPGYRAYSEGRLLSQSQLKYNAEKQLEREINSDISAIVRHISSL